jgi:hypothetical protein
MGLNEASEANVTCDKCREVITPGSRIVNLYAGVFEKIVPAEAPRYDWYLGLDAEGSDAYVDIDDDPSADWYYHEDCATAILVPYLTQQARELQDAIGGILNEVGA